MNTVRIADTLGVRAWLLIAAITALVRITLLKVENTLNEKPQWREIAGKKRLYNKAFPDRDDVILWDILPVRDGEKLKLDFESKNSEREQGLRLACDTGITGDDWTGKGVLLWYDHSPHEITFTCHTQDGFLSIYNIWDRGKGPESQKHSSGMLVEELPSGRRYRCNDIGFDTEFDKLVFRIEREHR